MEVCRGEERNGSKTGVRVKMQRGGAVKVVEYLGPIIQSSTQYKTTGGRGPAQVELL